MKRKIISFVICAALTLSVITGCKSKSSSAEVTSSTITSTVDSSNTTEATPTSSYTDETSAPESTTTSSEEPTTEEVVVNTPFVNPLTGEHTETDISSLRPYAVMINSIKAALPHLGTSYADVYVEIKEEGGVTRLLALFQDVAKVPKIGTIRSTREYFLSMAMGFDAILVHCGASNYADEDIKAHNFTNLNALASSGNYAGGAFYRDQDRKNAGYATEHTLITTGELLKSFSTKLGLSANHANANYTKLYFAEDGQGTPTNGTSATNITVRFSGYKSTKFKYNESEGKYAVEYFDAPCIDGLNNEQIKVTNVLILPVKNWMQDDHGTLQLYDLSGGEGYYISGGYCIPITWTKGDYFTEGQYANALKLFNQDGTPLELNVGKTYFCFPPNNCIQTIE